MLRRFAVPLTLVLAGCSGIRDALSAHQDVVARAGGQALTVERLAQMIAPAKQVPLRREIVDRIADIWVDYQLLGHAMAGGDSLLDSASVMAANWPAVAQRLADHLHESSIVRRADLDPRQVDSAYNVGDIRYIYHILVSVRQDTTDDVKARKRREAESYLAQLHRGVEFAKVASEHSEDPGSAEHGGSLGLVSRGMMVKPFEDAAFALRPGETSGIVQTTFGYHIIYRPLLTLVRDSFANRLKDVVIQRLDSAFLDSLTNRTDLRVRGSAPALMRSVAQNLRLAKDKSRVMATFRGGRLTEKDFARWLQAYPPQVRGQIVQAPDSTLMEFLRNIARNQMLLHAAEQRHIALTPLDRDSIREMYRRDVALMTNTLGVSRDSVAADTALRRPPTEVAAAHADRYLEQLLANPQASRFFEVPPFLSDLLRSRLAWSVSEAGVDRALERAKALRGPSITPLTPAPGGPPMGEARPGVMSPAPIQPRPRR